MADLSTTSEWTREVSVMAAQVSTRGVVTVLTGAGMSAGSGVPTFRDAQTGLWSRYDPMTLATPAAWHEDSALVWSWYQRRRALVRSVQPNDGHRALAQWAQHADVRIITQNVDDLHERAGSTGVVHVHGSLFECRCDTCRMSHDAPVVDPEDQPMSPPECECGGQVRPGIVWFGEELPDDAFGQAVEWAQDTDVFLLVGTSGVVYPAAGLPHLARSEGATVVEINPERTDLSDVCDHTIRASASVALPAILDAVVHA